MRCFHVLLLTLLMALLFSTAFGQHAEQPAAHHAMAHGIALAVEDDPAAEVMTVRVGPLNLPARSSHMAVPQAPDLYLSIPFHGWLIAYHPRLTDANGETLPSRLLHHVAFWNTGRSDFLCPQKEEHIFGAGGEMNDWVPLPGVGYQVAQGDRIRINTMFHNPTARTYPETYIEVNVEYRREQAGVPPLKSIYPAWFDVQECGSSGYDLEAGANVSSGEFTLAYPGLLLGVGGHLHDYGQELRLENASRQEEIARLTAEVDAQGRLLSIPIVSFFEQGGYRLEADEVVRVTAHYDNLTGGRLPDGAMGIVVGYFLPDDHTHMAGLKRAGPSTSHPR